MSRLIDTNVSIALIERMTGPVVPTSQHNEDLQRLENLEMLCELTETLLYRIHDLKRHASSHEGSVSKIGKYAENFLKSQREMTE